MIERGSSEEPKRKLFGQELPDSMANDPEIGEQLNRQLDLIENLGKLYRQVAENPNDEALLEVFIRAVTDAVEGNRDDLLSLITAGLSAIYLINSITGNK